VLRVLIQRPSGQDLVSNYNKCCGGGCAHAVILANRGCK
jgi:hypothetical protein